MLREFSVWSHLHFSKLFKGGDSGGGGVFDSIRVTAIKSYFKCSDGNKGKLYGSADETQRKALTLISYVQQCLCC